jgi:hypothetical protein
MIYINILFLLFSIIFLTISISGLGRLVTFKFQSNLFYDIFFGFIIVSLIITFIHFFFRINFLISFIILMTGLIFFFNKKNLNFIKVNKNKFIIYFFIIFIFIPMFLSQKYHEDFGYYHLPYSLAFIENKIIFGFSNINSAFVYNSIWLNISSLFFIQDKNFDFLTLPNFIIFLSFILFSINNTISKKKIEISDYYLIVVLLYFLLKFTRISEFGVDFALAVFSVFSIYFYLKFFEVDLENEKKFYFFCNVVFTLFAILIKLSSIPIILLSLFLYIKNFNKLKLFIFDYKFYFIYLLCLFFLIQQFIYTGCFVFPSEYTCLDVSWFSLEFLDIKKSLELTNKSYSEANRIYSAEEYLSNFNWFYYWLKRNYIEIIEHLFAMILPITLFILCLKNSKLNKELYLKEKNFFIFFIFLNLIFWLSFSPVYRFAIHLFISLLFLIVINILIRKIYSKKIFLSILTICILFSFSKNVKRLYEKNEIYIGIETINNQYILDSINSKDYAKIYYPDVNNNKKNGWQGRLCWDIPFICSYNRIKLDKKNDYLFFYRVN